MNKKKVLLALIFLLIFHSSAYAEKYVKIGRIIKIESSGNPNAYNPGSGARGLCQITAICLKEWNNFHPAQKYSANQLFNPEINMKIAEWYLNVRIPQMLKHYGKEVNIKNIIICYNAGINYVINRNKPLKKETADYLMKYGKGGE
jgi:soluble lytic murein transglycosylase-like protein